ncbi:DUF881 domain-containing protein [bacterium]|nr:MAG: DUF881 domain-containing protein [bacterium]
MATPASKTKCCCAWAMITGRKSWLGRGSRSLTSRRLGAGLRNSIWYPWSVPSGVLSPLISMPEVTKHRGRISSRSQSKAAGKGRNWIFSLTGVCFIFGGLLAMQLRAIQQVHANQQSEKEGILLAKAQTDKMRAEAIESAKVRAAQDAKISELTKSIKNGVSLTKSQLTALNAQIKELQSVAGLTSVVGSGIRITLADNPNAGTTGGDTAFLPGLVHDYDILQVVNELRSAKADAIAVKGAGRDAIRVTGYTPIRCVGPVIYVNWEPVAAPFTIEAVGDAATLSSALKMPNGIVDQLKNNGAIGVKVSDEENLKLPAAAGGAPKLRVAKAIL